MVSLEIDFAIRMYPERDRSLYFHFMRPVMGNMRKQIVFAKESGRKGKQDDRFGQIADKTQIEKAVLTDGLGTESKTAPLKLAYHRGNKQETFDTDRRLIV